MIIRLLEQLNRKRMTEVIRNRRDDVLGYLRKYEGRMGYPTYLCNGGQIASGSVASACKTVVN